MCPSFLTPLPSPPSADEAARENWIKYGHPDGPQAYRLGIALPEWFLTRDTDRKPLVLATLLLGGIMVPMGLLIFVIYRSQEKKRPVTAGGEWSCHVDTDIPHKFWLPQASFQSPVRLVTQSFFCDHEVLLRFQRAISCRPTCICSK